MSATPPAGEGEEGRQAEDTTGGRDGVVDGGLVGTEGVSAAARGGGEVCAGGGTRAAPSLLSSSSPSTARDRTEIPTDVAVVGAPQKVGRPVFAEWVGRVRQMKIGREREREVIDSNSVSIIS